LLFCLLVIGLLIDVAAGGALIHLWGWLLAAVIVVGTDVLTIRAARKLRSVTVTADEVVVGEHSLPRASILSVDGDVDPNLPVLGQTMRQGLPRGVAGLAAHLADGAAVVIPTRHPQRLAAVLQPGAASQASPRAVPHVRPAQPDELIELPELERRAETVFRVSGVALPEIPFPPDALHDAKAIFVADRPPVGYVRVDEVDGVAHIQALAVLPGMMRRGIGTSLLEAACSWASTHGYRAVTVITFADVPWNAPFYAARGFVVIDEVTPELAELRDWERAVGLDAVGTRVVMRRMLTVAPS
jgi:GNAT superfamily N-acetyltransferase